MLDLYIFRGTVWYFLISHEASLNLKRNGKNQNFNLLSNIFHSSFIHYHALNFFKNTVHEFPCINCVNVLLSSNNTSQVGILLVMWMTLGSFLYTFYVLNWVPVSILLRKNCLQWNQYFPSLNSFCHVNDAGIFLYTSYVSNWVPLQKSIFLRKIALNEING